MNDFVPPRPDPQQLDELVRRLSGLMPPGLAGLREEMEKNFRAVLQGGFEKLDLVNREEFEVQKAVLQKTRARLEQLEKQLQAMEASFESE